MKYKELIAKMTLEEKAVLLSGATTWQSKDYPHLGVPPMWMSDGPHGLRKQEGAADHLGLNGSVPATCFPTAATVANSWDPALGEAVGAALGEEAAAQRVDVLLGPGLNMKRSPLCGRNFEYFAEDPLLAGKMAAGYVRGIQSKGVSACPKHFAVNSQETRRMASDSVVDERALREVYLTGFEITVKESDPQAIMSSYNLVNGEYANDSKYLLTDVLRNDWGFHGIVITDWGGSNDHVAGVRAGSNLEMPAPGYDAAREVIRAVRTGELEESVVDQRVDELIRVVFNTTKAVNKAPDSFDKDAHHELAKKAAAECIVLLKNEENLLPLAAGTKVAVVGDFGKNPRYQGAGSSMVNSTKVENVADCVEASELVSVGYAKGFERFGQANEALKQEAVELAAKAEVVLMCMGLDEVQESEGLDRGGMKMAANQVEVLQAVAAVNPNVVVLLFAGSSVETQWAASCKSLLYAALGGQAGAAALVDAVVGKVNPSGKLTETWPVKYEDNPTATRFPADGRVSEFRESLYIGYRYYATAGIPVSFPFGFGLSYTSFAYSDLKVEKDGATVTVTNTGDRDGAEVVQLYVGKQDAKIFRPVRELKAFARVELKAGESKTVTLPIDEKAFRYWNIKTKGWEIEGGNYEIYVGSSSEDLPLTTTVEVQGTGAPNPYEGLELPHYTSGKVQEVPDAEFAAVLDRPIPAQFKGIDRNMTFGELTHGRSPIFWLVGMIIGSLLKSSLKKGKPDLNLLFIYNMPLRALAKMAGGMVSMGMVDGIVMEVKGFWIIGLIRVIVEFIINLIRNASMDAKLKAAAKKG